MFVGLGCSVGIVLGLWLFVCSTMFDVLVRSGFMNFWGLG